MREIKVTKRKFQRGFDIVLSCKLDDLNSSKWSLGNTDLRLKPDRQTELQKVESKNFFFEDHYCTRNYHKLRISNKRKALLSHTLKWFMSIDNQVIHDKQICLICQI